MRSTPLLAVVMGFGLCACAVIIGLDEGSSRDGVSAGGNDAAPVDAATTGEAGVGASYGDISDPARWELFDVTKLAAASTTPVTLGAFAGAVFDGRRVTLVPHGACESGWVAAFDTAKPFSTPESWSLYDLTKVSPAARGFFGGAFDGKQTHLAPSCNVTADSTGSATTTAPSGTVAVHDDGADLTAGWTTYTTSPATGGVPPSVVNGYHGAVFDGRFLYYVPAADGAVVRYDTTLPPDTSGLVSFATTALAPAARAFNGGVFDGKGVYFVPGATAGAPAACTTVVARYEVQGEFAATGSWSTFDLKSLDVNQAWCRFGGVFDGKYLYLPPFGGTLVVRYAVAGAFTDGLSWSVFDVAKVTPGAAHFGGAAFDGRFVYLLPHPSSSAPAVVMRYDTTATFTDAAAWSKFDLTTKGSNVGGFIGAAFDGRFVYFVPASAPLTAARFDARSPSAVPSTYRGSFL